MMHTERKYVYVVCGEAIHIENLHFSLKLLQTFTSYEILVVTDSRRNRIPIQHHAVINVETPPDFTNHQAAIYLKTSLHRILPNNCLYCYLDSDVVAVRPGVDSIFDLYQPPISFCTDHCTVKAFSPNAIHDITYDDLLNKQQQLSNLYYQCQIEETQQKVNAGDHLSKIETLKQAFNHKRPLHAQTIQLHNVLSVLIAKIFFWLLCSWVYILSIILKKTLTEREIILENCHRFIFKTPLHFYLFCKEQHYHYIESEQSWYHTSGQFLYKENLVISQIEARTPYRWDAREKIWRDEQGHNISTIESTKLLDLISEKFGVAVENPNWRHWNGGVFVFDRHSKVFMEQWHLWTLEIFKDAAWKVRDQGTLIATVWKFQLQQHPTLPIQYNLIADFYHPSLSYTGNLTFHFNRATEPIYPYFMHVYHHWGDNSWAVWRDIAQLHNSMEHPIKKKKESVN